MSSDWIKMRCNLWDDPRVSRICELTDEGEAAVVGALYWLWATADQHTESGVLMGLTLRQIDRKTGVNGFGQALCEVGWIADHPEGVSVSKVDSLGRELYILGIDRPRVGAFHWKQVRREVFQRDGWRCVYCGSEFRLECDHVHPLALGGTNSISNLATACFACNRSKGAKALSNWRAAS